MYTSVVSAPKLVTSALSHNWDSSVSSSEYEITIAGTVVKAVRMEARASRRESFSTKRRRRVVVEKRVVTNDPVIFDPSVIRS